MPIKQTAIRRDSPKCFCCANHSQRLYYFKPRGSMHFCFTCLSLLLDRALDNATILLKVEREAQQMENLRNVPFEERSAKKQVHLLQKERQLKAKRLESVGVDPLIKRYIRPY